MVSFFDSGAVEESCSYNGFKIPRFIRNDTERNIIIASRLAGLNNFGACYVSDFIVLWL